VAIVKRRVGVLYGGRSSEREVSLRSGQAVFEALVARGHDAVLVDVGLDVAQRLAAERVEVAFIALHGRYGEDGCVQGLLESMGIPYTGSGVAASALGMDKTLAKVVLAARGVPVPDGLTLTPAAARGFDAAKLPFPFPVFVKPAREGSSVGVHLCNDAAALTAALADADKYGDLLVERYHRGREVQGAVLDGEGLGVIEVRPRSAFYDYQAKYHSGGTTEYLFPAPLPPADYQRVLDTAVAAHRALGCAGATRSDLILGEDGSLVLLEVNTLPGMTASSLLPKIAAGKGLDFPSLCERLLESAKLHA